MSLNFYRRVAFGLSPNEKPDKDPLNWAINQLDTIPDLLWPGTIPTEKDLRKKYGEWVYGDREVLRKKFKNDKHAYRNCLLYTSPSPRDLSTSRMPSSA